MTPDERREFEDLQAEQRRLRTALERLDERLDVLSRSLEREKAPAPAPTITIPPPPPPLPPPIPVAAKIAPSEPQPETIPAEVAHAATESPTVESEPAPAPTRPGPPPLPRRELEIQLGTVWLARIGIVILLTGLVFLGNYAWQNWVAHMGAGGKLAMIYAAGAALCGVGAWLRRGPEAMRNYAQVLIAGGGATIYYATYAAHFVERLRVIESPIVGGILLLLIGGAFLWWADWRKLQPAALLAIVLSYYTSAINEVGNFTLFSSLLLTAAGVFLVIRHRWVAISWASLAGTYVSYAYWDWFREVTGSAPRAEWNTALAFLCAYWLLFTALVFFCRAPAFRASMRVAFLSLNNAALFFLGLHAIWGHSADAPWIFTLSFGVALLALAAAAWRWRRDELDLDSAFLLQGVGFATAGLAMKLSGEQLAFVLAAESLVLLGGSGRRHGWLFELLGGLAGTWAFGEAWFAIGNTPEHMLLISGVVSAFLIADAWWLKVRRGEWRAMQLHWRALIFCGLALLLVARVLPQLVHYPWEPASFAIAAVVCTASIYLLRLPELTLLGQLYLVAALVMWLTDLHTQVETAPWWEPWPLALSALGLAHWWQRQRIWSAGPRLALPLQFVMAGALISVVFLTMEGHLHADSWLLGLSIAALATLAYGFLTRSWVLAICGQFFTLVGVTLFLVSLTGTRFGGPVALGVVGVLFATCAMLVLAPAEGWGANTGKPELEAISLLYWFAGWLVLSVWVFTYVAAPWWSITFAALAAALLSVGAFSGKPTPQVTGGCMAVLSYIAFLRHFQSAPTVVEILALILPPLTLRLTSRRLSTAPLFEWLLPTVSGFTAGCLWLWATRWTNWHHYGHALTVVWAVVALLVLAAGFALRERAYRLGGLAILALAIGRIFVIDVWELETIFRIISFLSLGAVLLALGYLYNRFSDRIRKWL